MAFMPDLRFFNVDDDVVDLVGVHPFKPTERRQPKSKTELISAVAHSSHVGRELRALGSAWSLSPATEAPDIVDTFSLHKHLSPPHGGSASLDATRLAGATNVLGMFCRRHSTEVAGRSFVHVEAGIKIAQLLEDLKSCGLALPTMGAGGGQSLAGALSTGTHGADFMVPPLVEWVRAVHLVGPLGKEWWITPANSIFTGADVLQLPGWPPAGEIFANDDAFNTVRVAVGRLGIIYSLILEVVERYTLLEITHQGANSGGGFSGPVQRVSYQGQVFANQGGVSEGQVFTNPGLDKNSWPTVRKQLSNSGVVDGKLFGIFDTPITDFDTGWLRQEVIEPTVAAVIEAFKSKASAADVATDPTGHSLADEFYTNLTSQEREQLDGAALSIFGSGDLRSTFDGLGLTNFIVHRMGLEQLAKGLQGSSVKPLRHLNIVVSLAMPEVCWVTRRWALPDVTATANLGRAELDDFSKALSQHRNDPMPILTLISNNIVESIKRAINSSLVEFSPFFVFEPFIGAGIGEAGAKVLLRVERFISREVARINQAVTAAEGTSGEAAFLFMYRAATDPDVSELHGPIRSRVTGVIGSNAFVNPARAGESNDVLDVHSYELDYTACGDSAEYLFDASKGDYLGFADKVLELSAKHDPVFGYMGIRFTPKASALIAMQRYELTASVEVATVRARTDLVYAEFWVAVHEAARANSGIPHWGQEFIPSADEVATHYGEDLTRWRQVLTELSVDDPDVFSTDFTRDLGLEPSGSAGLLLYDALTAFLTALEGASDS